MATSTTVNAQLIKYDASGNQTIINPKTLAQDVTITANSNKTSITNLQSLITALGSLAFQSYTIVTSLSSAKSGTLVDGGVIADLNTTLTDLQSEVTSMSSISQGGFDTFMPSLSFSGTSTKVVTISGSSGTFSISTVNTYDEGYGSPYCYFEESPISSAFDITASTSNFSSITAFDTITQTVSNAVVFSDTSGTATITFSSGSSYNNTNTFTLTDSEQPGTLNAYAKLSSNSSITTPTTPIYTVNGSSITISGYKASASFFAWMQIYCAGTTTDSIITNKNYYSGTYSDFSTTMTITSTITYTLTNVFGYA